MANKGVRVGAAAFALGLSLAGPQAVGIAAADSTDADSPSVSAGPHAATATPPAAGRRSAVRATRSPGSTASVATPSPRAAATTISPEDGPSITTSRTARATRSAAARTQTRRQTSGAAAVSSTERPGSAVSPSAAQVQASRVPAPGAAQPVGGAATAPAVTQNVVAAVSSPAPVAAITAQPAAAALPAPGQAIATATVRVARAFDRIGNWLSRLPATPITDFLSGALLLVRRTLLPNVPTIPALTVSNVSVLEGDSGTTDAVFTVTLDKAYDTPVTVGYATSPDFDPALPTLWGQIQVWLESSPVNTTNATEYLPGPKGFTPATAGEDYAPVDLELLTFDPGQTSQQVSVTVLGDTTDEPTETFDLNIYATLPSGAPAAVTNPGRAAAAAANVPTGVVLGQGIGTIISDDNPACVQTKDCSGADLSDRRLSGDLSDVNFEDANLYRANLSGANLTGATLTRATLTRAKLSGAKLFGAKLSSANLRSADLIDAKLTKADLSGANLYDANLYGAKLTNANLSDANLNGANLRSANLFGADLTGANLRSANLYGADLSVADLTGATLTRANLYAANLTSATLRSADLTGAKLTGAKLSGANLTDANLSVADLTRANLLYATLKGANLLGVTWFNTYCPDGSITNTGCSVR